MNNKGFTLTELLVTIAVMGIILGMAFPAISNLKDQNNNKKYEAYEKVLLNGAKIYMDSRKKDYFITSSCRSISLSDLKSTDLVKDYNEKNTDCSTSNVIVKKDSGGNLTYTPIVICTKSGKEVYRSKESDSCSNYTNPY